MGVSERPRWPVAGSRALGEGTLRAWQAGLGSLVLRQELFPAGQRLGPAWATQLANRPFSHTEGSSYGNVVTCLKAGHQSILDISLQEKYRPLVEEGCLPGDGYPHREERNSTEGTSAFRSPLPGFPGTLPPQGAQPDQAVWGKTTPLPPPPRCLPWTGLVHKEKGFPGRRDFPPGLQLQRARTMHPRSWFSSLY